MTGLPYRLGKKPARPGAMKLKLSAVLAKADWPVVPVNFGGHNRVRDWGMLGNDKYGDCVWAGAGHEHMMATMVGDVPDATFTTENVLSDYTALTGFSPTDEATDQGTDMVQAAEYRRTTGVVDASGRRHKIAAYLSLKVGDPSQLALAMYLFGIVGIGLRFSNKAMQQFDDHIPWSVVPKAKFEGGHYVPAVGRNSKGHFLVVTWGRLHAMTPSFYAKYCDEAIVYFTDEFLIDGTTPQGFNLAKLKTFFAQLGG